MSEQTGSWQPDPFGRHQYRYWDGAQWSDQVSNDGVVQTDPPVGDPAAAVTEQPPAETPAEAAPTEPAAAEPEPAPVTEQPPAAPSSPEPAGWAASPQPDATTSMPAASYPPPTAPAPGGPGDPNAPGPPPADSNGGGGGSKAPIVIIILIILALIAGAAAYFLLMDDDDEAREDLISGFEDQMGLSESDAECIVDQLDDDFDLSELADAVEDNDEPTDAQQTAIANAFSECEIGGSAAPPDDEGDDTTTTEPDDEGNHTTTTTEPDDDDGPSGPGDVEIPPAMMAMIAQQMADELGITTDEAECLVEGLFTGEGFESMLTDPDAMDLDSMGSAFELFDECGVDPAEIEDGGGGGFGTDTADTYGDDAELDALWDACEGGDMDSCDELYFTSPFDSEYETFGDTCGGRQDEGTNNLCAAEFG